MRYRIKLTVVATKDGKTHTFNKYFRYKNAFTCYEKQRKFVGELVDQGYKICTEISVGSWVS